MDPAWHMYTQAWATTPVCANVEIRQFEFGMHDATADLAACGTLAGCCVIVDHSAPGGRVLGAVRKLGETTSDSVLGLAWLRRTPHLFVAGATRGAIRMVDVRAVLDASGAAQEEVTLNGLPLVPELPVVHSYPKVPRLTCVHVNCDDSWVVSSGYNPHVTVMDAGTGKLVREFRHAHEQHINITRFSYLSPHVFATSSFDRTVKMWDMRVGGGTREKPVFTLRAERGNVTLSFSPNDEYLLASSVDNDVRCYRAVDGRLLLRMDLPHMGRSDNYTRAYFMDGGEAVVSGSSEESVVRVNNAATGELCYTHALYDGRRSAALYLQSLRGHPRRRGYVCALVNCRDPSVGIHMVQVAAQVSPAQGCLSNVPGRQFSALLWQLFCEAQAELVDTSQATLIVVEQDGRTWRSQRVAQFAASASSPSSRPGCPSSGVDLVLLCRGEDRVVRVHAHSSILRARFAWLARLLAEAGPVDGGCCVVSLLQVADTPAEAVVYAVAYAYTDSLHGVMELGLRDTTREGSAASSMRADIQRWCSLAAAASATSASQDLVAQANAALPSAVSVVAHTSRAAAARLQSVALKREVPLGPLSFSCKADGSKEQAGLHVLMHDVVELVPPAYVDGQVTQPDSARESSTQPHVTVRELSSAATVGVDAAEQSVSVDWEQVRCTAVLPATLRSAADEILLRQFRASTLAACVFEVPRLAQLAMWRLLSGYAAPGALTFAMFPSLCLWYCASQVPASPLSTPECAESWARFRGVLVHWAASRLPALERYGTLTALEDDAAAAAPPVSIVQRQLISDIITMYIEQVAEQPPAGQSSEEHDVTARIATVFARLHRLMAGATAVVSPRLSPTRISEQAPHRLRHLAGPLQRSVALQQYVAHGSTPASLPWQASKAYRRLLHDLALGGAEDPVFRSSTCSWVLPLTWHQAVLVADGMNPHSERYGSYVAFLGGQACRTSMTSKVMMTLDVLSSEAADRPANTGVWNKVHLDGETPSVLMNAPAVSLSFRPSRFVLVYPGFCSSHGYPGPGASTWVEPMETCLHAWTEALGVEPRVGPLPRAWSRRLTDALVHSRVFLLDTRTQHWSCVTPAWEHDWSRYAPVRSEDDDGAPGGAPLARYGHSVVAFPRVRPEHSVSPPSLDAEQFSHIVFGGYQYRFEGQAARLLGDVWELRTTMAQRTGSGDVTASLRWLPVHVTGLAPAPRLAHASCVLPMSSEEGGPVMLVTGGSGRQVFGDVAVLQLRDDVATSAAEWLPTMVFGSPMSRRYGHSMVSVFSGDVSATTPASVTAHTAVIFGGRDATGTFQDVHVLTCVKPSGSTSCVLHWSTPQLLSPTLGPTRRERASATYVPHWSIAATSTAQSPVTSPAVSTDRMEVVPGGIIVFGGHSATPTPREHRTAASTPIPLSPRERGHASSSPTATDALNATGESILELYAYPQIADVNDEFAEDEDGAEDDEVGKDPNVYVLSLSYARRAEASVPGSADGMLHVVNARAATRTPRMDDALEADPINVADVRAQVLAPLEDQHVTTAYLAARARLKRYVLRLQWSANWTQPACRYNQSTREPLVQVSPSTRYADMASMYTPHSAERPTTACGDFLLYAAPSEPAESEPAVDSAAGLHVSCTVPVADSAVSTHAWLLRRRCTTFSVMLGGSAASSASSYAETSRGYALMDMSPGTLRSFLHYVYTDTLLASDDPDMWMKLFTAACLYDVPRLAYLVEARLVSCIDEHNACGLLAWAHGLGVIPHVEAGSGDVVAPGSMLRAACMSFLLRNFATLRTSDDFLALPDALREDVHRMWSSDQHLYVFERHDAG